MPTLSDDAALLEWADLMQLTDDALADLAQVEMLPVNADGYFCWAVLHPATNELPSGVPSPGYRISEGTVTQSVWFLKVAVPQDKTKAVNAWKMTMAMLCAATGGRELSEIANPMPWAESAQWSGATTDITTMKDALGKAGYWKHRFYTEARSNGGTAMTAAQTAARRANLVAARETAKPLHAERALARARDQVAMAETGATDAQIADAFGLAVGSVATTVARARLRVRPEAPQTSDEPGDRRVSLEELADMMSTEGASTTA